jgi:NitT/TauT family transport system ATP-binding protein
MINVISILNVSKKYPEQSNFALKDINLEVSEGEFFCLIGPSGCGKSTLLKLIIGIEKPTMGEIKVSGDLSMVFQSGALLPWLSVLDNASFGLEMNGVKKAPAQEQAKKYLEMVGLLDFLKKYPRELSGGQKQRVGIARALSMETPILLLDEPFSALDPQTTRELHDDLISIWEKTGKTIVMISHITEEAVVLSDRIGMMKEGELKKIVEVNLERPRNEKGESFIKILDSLSGV